jgi:hypothetical protein
MINGWERQRDEIGMRGGKSGKLLMGKAKIRENEFLFLPMRGFLSMLGAEVERK